MSDTGQELDVEKSDAEQKTTFVDGSNEDFNLEGGVTRPYELKCELSE